jgi:hypothetical protein
MKRTWMLCLICLLSFGTIAWSQAQTSGGTEKAVAALGTTMASITKNK